MSTLRAFAVVALLLGCVGTEVSSGPDGMPTPIEPGLANPDAIVAISLAPDSLRVFTPNFYQQRLYVQGVTRAGERANLSRVRWTSSDPATAMVDSVDGTLYTLKTGSARIVVKWQAMADTAELIVETLCRGGLSSSGPAQLRVGEQTRFTASIVPCANTPGATVRFVSNDTTVVAITPDGLAAARAAGTTVITATLESKNTSLSVARTVTVVP